MEKPPILSDEKIRMSCLGKGFYYAGEREESATDSAPIFMPQFRRVCKAQRDADVEWFKESKCGHCDAPLLREVELYEKLQQAKAGVAREKVEEINNLFETIEATYPELRQVYWKSKGWQSLKSRYGGQK